VIAALPLLLLDVDGVLCPLGDRGREPLVEHGVAGETYFCFSVHRAARLRRRAKSFRLVWATSSEHEANAVIAPLFELPPLPVIVSNDDAGEGESWKLPAIRDCVGDRPFACIDDAVGVDAVEWAATRAAPTLLLPISGDRGLLAADVDELERFRSRDRRSQRLISRQDRTCRGSPRQVPP